MKNSVLGDDDLTVRDVPASRQDLLVPARKIVNAAVSFRLDDLAGALGRHDAKRITDRKSVV